LVTCHYSLVRGVTGPNPNLNPNVVVDLGRSQISDLTSHFKDGSYDVISGAKLLPPA